MRTKRLKGSERIMHNAIFVDVPCPLRHFVLVGHADSAVNPVVGPRTESIRPNLVFLG